MSRLIVVRHGQASAGTDDYDRLSPRGHVQSERLGRWLASAGVRPARVVCGRMRRHRQTFDALCAGAGDWPFPPPDIDAGLDEFDHGAVLRCFLERYPEHPTATIGARLWQAEPFEVAALLRAALGAWSRCELDADVPEAWQAFRTRVRDAATRLAHAGGGDVLVVTSGGVLAQLAQAALDAPDARVVDLNLGIRNSAVCEFLPSGDGLRLLSWNALPHLADAPELWTHY